MDSRLAQHRCTVDERMHNQILGRSEMSDVIPGTGRFRREYIPVRHRVRRSSLQVIVSIIAHDQIRLIHKFCHRSRAELLHARKQSAVRILRKPVIRIHHFKITAVARCSPR